MLKYKMSNKIESCECITLNPFFLFNQKVNIMSKEQKEYLEAMKKILEILDQNLRRYLDILILEKS